MGLAPRKGRRRSVNFRPLNDKTIEAPIRRVNERQKTRLLGGGFCCGLLVFFHEPRGGERKRGGSAHKGGVKVNSGLKNFSGRKFPPKRWCKGEEKRVSTQENRQIRRCPLIIRKHARCGDGKVVWGTEGRNDQPRRG